MSLSAQLQIELQNLIGFQSAAAHRTRLSDPSGFELEVGFLQVDSLSCAVDEIQLMIPSQSNVSLQTLEDWANRLCSRITYLLEHIGPLELDAQNQEALIRSTPPSQQSTGTKYFEIILKARNRGWFSLRRYEAVKGLPGRTPVPMQLTHEVLLKLVDDLVATSP